jgi:nitroreductase
MSENNPVITALRTRRSVRSYRPQPVSREQLQTIVDCGRLAPSSNNRQSWEFVVVTDRDRLRGLAELTDHGKFIAEAAACIVVCGDRDHRSVYLDGAAATENMLIAIHAQGLGGCWVQAFGKPYEGAIRQLFRIPERLALVAMVPLGWPEEKARMPGKRSLSEVLHWERF